MKIITELQLTDALATDLAWRKKEMSTLRSAIELRTLGVDKRDMLRRCGAALSYAHFEGYIKNASQYYLEFVHRKKLKADKISLNFLSLVSQIKAKAYPGTNKASLYFDIVCTLTAEPKQTIELPFKTGIHTGFNVSSEIFKEIIWCLGLDYSPFATKEKFIDHRLLKLRNNIAHGQGNIVSVTDYNEIHTEVFYLINNFKTQIDNAVSLKKYQRTP